MKEKAKPSKQALIILECLQQAVDKELERKRRLGHYAVMADNEGKIFFYGGEDAPDSVEEALREINEER